MKTLITDAIPLVFTLLEGESVNGHKKLRGLFHLAETKNANGRVYPRKLLEREVSRIMPAINQRRILGELNHPMDPQINLEKSSHVITNLKVQGNKVYGELESLKTPAGRILDGLIESGIRLGISSRGLGSLMENQEGTKVVQDDYSLVTWDVVANPSTPDAWLGESVIHVTESDDYVLLDNSERITENLGSNKINLQLMNEINKLFGGK